MGTILLSNSGKQPYEQKKKIRIKSIDLSQKDLMNGSKTKKGNQEMENELHNARKELTEVLNEKNLLIQKTKEIVIREKNNWKAEKEQWIEAAKEQGFSEGLLLGKEEGFNKYQQLLDEANALTETALKDYHTTVEKSNETILDLAIHTAQRIVKEKISEDPHVFMNIVKTAIKEIKDQPVISIYLHPGNYSNVLQQKEELVQLLENEAKLSIYTRENMDENSCLIEHPFGQIDASVDTQLHQLRSALQTIAMENKS